jgi:hypothetical protein
MTDRRKNDLQPLRLRALILRALATYRANILRLSAVALVVFLLPALGSTALDEREVHIPRDAALLVVLLVTLTLVEVCITELGTTFYSGFLDQLVGEEQHRHARRSIGEVVRTLPYLRLLGASFLVTVATSLATLLLVVPGAIVYTLLCLTGPLINIERLGILAAMRRSFRLVRPRFWFVFVAVTIPVIAESGLDSGLEYLLHGQPWLEALIVNGLLAITILTVVSLIEVTLAHELVARDRVQPTGATPVGS